MENTHETKQKSVRLKPDLIQKVEKMAEEQNRTWNNMVETILINETRKYC